MADGVSASRILRWILAGAAALAALWLAWLIVAVAMARMTAETAPDEALRWRPGHAAALARKAELALPEAVFERDTAPVEALARRALAHGPLEIVALRVLGEAAQSRDDQAKARTLMNIAAARSLRDGASHAWMFHDGLENGRYAEAFAHARPLMHVQTARRPIARRMAAAAAGDPKARKALADAFLDGDERPGVLSHELAAAMDPGAFFYFLIDLNEAGGTVREDEAARAVENLLRERGAEQAYLAWVQLLPPEGRKGLGNVYDGDFDGLPGPAPFNWRLGKTVLAQIGPGPGGEGSSLYVQYEGDQPRELTGQTLLLPPGAYRLRLRARMAEAGYGEQLVWSVTCGDEKRPLFSLTAPDEADVWRELSAGFVTPPGCAAQRLQLAGRPGDRVGFVRGWFDGMIIEQRGGN